MFACYSISMFFTVISSGVGAGPVGTAPHGQTKIFQTPFK